MDLIEGVAAQIRSVGHNMSDTLGLIPRDKLDWHPAPGAKSAVEVANEAACSLRTVLSVLAAGAWQWPSGPVLQNLEDVRGLIRSSANQFAAHLERLSPADHDGSVEMPWGTCSIARAALRTLVELVHHYGQISYIHSLLEHDAELYVARPRAAPTAHATLHQD
jgi:hypothetical protein